MTQVPCVAAPLYNVQKQSPSIQVKALHVKFLNKNSAFKDALGSLSPYRQKKTLHLLYRRDQNLCLGTGLLLDNLLQTYDLREKDMKYIINEYGKPCLYGFPNLHFNLSQAGSYVVGAIGPVALGIDIEQVRLYDWDIASRCMSEAELAYLHHLPDSKRPEEFTRLWTLKKSYRKAIGASLGERFFPALEIAPEKPPHLYGEKENNCFFWEFDQPGYRGALCWTSTAEQEQEIIPPTEIEWQTSV